MVTQHARLIRMSPSLSNRTTCARAGQRQAEGEAGMAAHRRVAHRGVEASFRVARPSAGRPGGHDDGVAAQRRERLEVPPCCIIGEPCLVADQHDDGCWSRAWSKAILMRSGVWSFSTVVGQLNAIRKRSVKVAALSR